MLDIKFIRENPELVKRITREKGVSVDIDRLLDLDQERRNIIGEIEKIQAARNRLAKEAGKGEPAQAQIKLGKDLKSQAETLEAEQKTVDSEYTKLLHMVPNLPSADTPVGEDETSNKVLRKWGKIPKFDFTPLEHWQLAENLGLIDVERASKVTGSRFVYLKGNLVKLQFAITTWVINELTNQKTLDKIAKKAKLKVNTTPFQLILPPMMVRTDVLSKMGRLEPKEERYHLAADELYLVGSSEHTLGPLHMDETIKETDLPIRYLGYSTNFRREAGSYGKDTHGLFRLHQFDKLEMESFTKSGDSLSEQEFLIAIQEYLMQQLKIPYQVIICATGDMGGPDARHIDIEAWLPGQKKYRETHSADMMTDYQSRRLNTKVKLKGGTELVHMNDATAIALSRTPIAILENYQQKDGSVLIPDVLQKYFGDKTL